MKSVFAGMIALVAAMNLAFSEEVGFSGCDDAGNAYTTDGKVMRTYDGNVMGWADVSFVVQPTYAIMTGCSNKDRAVTVPATADISQDHYPLIVRADNVPVTGFRAAFDPDSVESLDGGENLVSFEGGNQGRPNSKLRAVSLQDAQKLKSLGQHVFSSCSALAAVTLPNALEEIGSYAFYGCLALQTITLPQELKAIRASTFYGCTSLCSIIVPEKVSSIEQDAFYGCESLETVKIPNSVKSITPAAFAGCEKITSVVIPSEFRMSEIFPNSYLTLSKVTIASGSVTICNYAFKDCMHMSSVSIPDGVTEIGESAFENCRHLEVVTIPASVKRIGECAFYGCLSLKEVKYLGEKPEIGNAAFAGTALASGQTVELMINSANVHYVLNSIKPEFAVPLSEDTGFRNIITEIKGGAVSIPSTWASNYANFEKKFGTDFTKALMKTTGKFGGDGKELMVWQDYIAGTDPTNEKDVFTASITVVDGKVTVSYSPELDDGRKAVRKYTTWGKQRLQDVEWTEVPSGQEGNYNFFKVSVEMK